MRRTSYSLLLSILGLGLAACPSTPAPGNDAAMVLTDAGPADTGAPMLCTTHVPMCQDQQIAMLDLMTSVSTRTVEEEGTVTGGVHHTHVDAMAGGSMPPRESYVYARFTETGLVRVDISDEEAFASQDWDIAFRRFVIRLNSGVSGPSCVQGARVPNDASGNPPAFDSITTLPTGLAFHDETYMTDTTCDPVPDGSGLGSPGTVLSSFWTYPGCVAMSHNVYVIALADGRHVRLEVVGYYNPADQTACDTTGAMPTTTGSSANIRVQWAYLD